jgi:hypothetical protein
MQDRPSNRHNQLGGRLDELDIAVRLPRHAGQGAAVGCEGVPSPWAFTRGHGADRSVTTSIALCGRVAPSDSSGSASTAPRPGVYRATALRHRTSPRARWGQ